MSDGELADCASVFVARSDSVSVPDSVGLSPCLHNLTASPHSETENLSASLQASQIFCCASQTPSFSEKRDAQWHHVA